MSIIQITAVFLEVIQDTSCADNSFVLTGQQFTGTLTFMNQVPCKDWLDAVVRHKVVKERCEMVLRTEASRTAIDEWLHLAEVEVIGKRVNVSEIFDFITLVSEKQSKLFNQQPQTKKIL